MTDRYTHHDADEAFNRLCRVLGKTPAMYRSVPHDYIAKDGEVQLTGAVSIPGGWSLDYYRGYLVAEMAYGSCGESHPFGDRRRTAREFCLMVTDIINAITIYEAQFGRANATA